MTEREIELHRMWDIIPVDEQGWIHLRALHSQRKAVRNIHLSPLEYPCLNERKAAFAETAFKLNDAGYNIYTCLNPIRSDFVPPPDEGVKDTDIARRSRVLIDLDRVEGRKNPATQDDLDRALDLSNEIERFLIDQFSKSLHRLMSGNGIHLYLPVDLPNDTNSALLCQKLLRSLSLRFSNNHIEIDTSVHNASRITKVPGTIARKGTASEARPYRMARVV